MSWAGTIPIYINNFNLLTWPKSLAEFFSDIPQTEVIFVDNASTYPPLLDWYAKESPYKVIRLGTNGGKHAAWKHSAILPRHVHQGLFGSEFYVVTDPDLCFADCPKDVMDVLVEGMQRFPTANKVGVSLEIEDVPDNSLFGLKAKRWEQKFWESRFDSQFYRAGIDTTFALYSINTPYRNARRTNNNALRSDRPYTARHMPWYLKSDSLTEEELFYFQSAQNGMWSRKAGRLMTKDDSAMPKQNRREMFGLSLVDVDSFEADWRISDELLYATNELLLMLQPDSILEAGAGVSSLLFYYYQASRPETVFVSHDELGHWNDRLMSQVARLGFSASNIVTSQIVNGFYEHSSPDIDRHRPFDLILFDGPSGRNRASEKSQSFVIQNGNSDSVYIIDDTNRPGLASLVDLLKVHFGRGAFHVFNITDKTHPHRISTVLVPRGKLGIVRRSTIWNELAVEV